jgi:hypothetical protein
MRRGRRKGESNPVGPEALASSASLRGKIRLFGQTLRGRMASSMIDLAVRT